MNTNLLLRFTIIALLLNNCIGVLLNFELTVLSAIFVFGIPGIIFLFVLFFWTFKTHYRKPSHYIVWASVMIPYNVLVYYIAIDLADDVELATFKSIGGFATLFPLINCILLSILFGTSVHELSKQDKALSEDKALF